MREVLRIVLLIINIISFILVFLFGLTGIVYEIFGPAAYEKMLTKLKIPWSYGRMFVCLIILIITYILSKKFFKT